LLGTFAPTEFAVDTVQTLTTPHHQAGDHVIADGNVAHVGTNRLNHAGTLVAKNHGERANEHTIEHMCVAMAQAGGQRFDQDLTPNRLVMGYINNLKIQSIKQHGSSHGEAVYDPGTRRDGVRRTADRNS
jgi:hypothetical protein